MKPRLALLVVPAALLASSLAAAQDEYDLANALAERGWYDLSQELFERLLKSPDADTRAEGRYGLARTKILMAERAESPEEKGKMFDAAIAEVESFLKDFPNHRRRGEALSDIGTLYQSKGKSLMALAKADPTKAEAAEKAFQAAEKLFLDLIEQLKKEEKKRPDSSDQQKNPSAYKAALKAFEEWELKTMYAKYNYAVALFSHAETYKDTPAKHAEMRRLLEKMISFLSNEFIWLYEWYLLAYDAFIYMGRAYQILAETSERERAEEYWKQCFGHINKARSLLSDPENRKNESVREVCSRALLYEVKAYIASGDARRGPASLRQYAEAARRAEEFFRTFPNLRFEELGKAIQLEQARAYCKGGQLDKGIRILQDLSKQGKGTWVENIAVDILGEFAGEQNVSLAVEAADNYFERGPAFLYRAIQKYRRVLQNIRRAEDEKYRAYAWYQIGRCYYYLDRFYEAAEALTVLQNPPMNRSPEAPQAAMLKRNALARIARITKDKNDEKALEEFRAWLVRTYPREAGKQEIRQLALDAEAKEQFLEAARTWEKLAQPDPDNALQEEALFNVGFNLYRAGNRLLETAKGAEREKVTGQVVDLWKRALESFRKHLALVEKMTSKDARTVKNATGSILFSCRILIHPRFDQAAEALRISDDLERRFPNADPKLVIAIMSMRINAKVKAGNILEAEEDFAILKSKYEKEKVGSDYYLNALAALANAFQEAAAREREKDPEKYELFSEKAGDYYYGYFVLNVGEVRKPEQMEGMADMLLSVAEQRMKKGLARGSKEEIDQARKIFGQARELFTAFRHDQEPRLSKEQLRLLDRKITRCYLMTGQFEEALKIYQDITKNDPEMKDGSAWEDMADCHFERGMAAPRGPDRKEYFRQADKVYAALAARLVQASLYNEHTWRLLHKHAQCLFETDPDQARYFFDTYDLKGYGKEWDGGKWGYQAKFEELRKKVDEKVPPRKSGTP